MERLETMTSLDDLVSSIGSLLSSSGAGTKPGSGGSEDARLFEAALSLVQALVAQASSAGGSGPPADPTGAAPAAAPEGVSQGSAASGTAATGSATPPAVGPSATDGTAGATGSGTSTVSAGSGANSTTITDTSTHDEEIGQFLNGGSTTTPTAEIDLKPGQSGTLSYQDGQGGFDQETDASGKFAPAASRLEFYADQNGKNNDDVSYIDGRDASISVSDGQGRTAGDKQSIAANAPADTLSRDAAGNPTIQGWYDGSTGAMQDGGAYMQGKLGTGDAYIHPDDDQNKTPGGNPMTMAGDSSQHYTATFGNA